MIIKIVGIDPGIHNCGVALGEFNTDTNYLVIKDFFTIHASELAKKANRKDSNFYGSIFSLFLLEKEFTAVFTNFQPDYVASEDAFYNPRTPNAYASLKGCILSIKRVLYNFKFACSCTNTSGCRNSMFNLYQSIYSVYSTISMSG